MMRVWKPSSAEIQLTGDWGEWNKEVSEFPWFYEEPETCYILDGEAYVTDDQGNSIRFREGDMVHFDQGVQCTWNIVRDIRKKYLFG